ncbi:MAG: PTS sugar transporter subunit IIC [Clostridiales bacterium]|jgi:PTS system cellobiose-specific IIC component|nr:PTS sugar transporter subunit IIC [Clostridiales bacterium]
MSGNFSSFNTNLQKYVAKFTALKGVIALKDGIVYAMPVSLIGSIFLMIRFMPFAGYDKFMAGIFGPNWAEPLNQVTGATFDISALISVMAIAYVYAKASKAEPLSCAFLALVNFIILIPAYVNDAAGTAIGGVIPKAWAGGQGMIASIIVALVTAEIYCFCNRKGLRIKMPDGVPEGVINAFSALIPALFTMTLSFIIYIIVKAATQVTLIEWIYQVLQLPLQGLSDSFISCILMAFLISFFWWCGIHGAYLVGAIIGPIIFANSLANQAVIDAGGTLVAGQNALIVTDQIRSNFIVMTGSGISIGIVVGAILFAKSKQYKELGRLSLIPGLFNINEPIVFGIPIVMNTKMFWPFTLAPVMGAAISYIATAIGFMPVFGAVAVPWTTPPIISGFLLGGWRAALVQLIILVLACVIYLPFFKQMDTEAFAREATAVDDDEDF